METTEEVISRLERNVERAMVIPSFPFWLLLKLIWFEFRGKRVKSVNLHAPYHIQFRNSLTTG